MSDDLPSILDILSSTNRKLSIEDVGQVNTAVEKTRVATKAFDTIFSLHVRKKLNDITMIFDDIEMSLLNRFEGMEDRDAINFSKVLLAKQKIYMDYALKTQEMDSNAKGLPTGADGAVEDNSFEKLNKEKMKKVINALQQAIKTKEKTKDKTRKKRKS